MQSTQRPWVLLLTTYLRVQGHCEEVVGINWRAECEKMKLDVNRSILSDSQEHAQHSAIYLVSKS